MVLPGVVVALWALGRWVRQRQGEVLTHRAFAGEIAILIMLMLVVRGRSSLGLTDRPDLIDSLIVAGLALLLAHHVAMLVKALGSILADGSPISPPWPFLLLPLLVYVAVLPWSSEHREPDGDEPYYLLIAHSLAYDLDTDLSNNYEAKDSLLFMSRELKPEWADPRSGEGRSFSRHNLTLPLLLAPGYRLAGKSGALLTMALLSALTAWMMMRLALRLFPDQVQASVAAWALFSLTPPFLTYSYQVWTEVPATLLLLVSLDQIYTLQTGSGNTRRNWLNLVVALALLPLLKLRFLLIASSLALLAGLRVGRSRKHVIRLALVLVAVIGVMLTYNLVFFDQPLKDHSLTTLKQIQAKSPSEYIKGGVGLLFDCAFGLFASNPLWLLVMPGLVVMIRRRFSLLLDVAVCALPYLLVVTPRLEWYGAWSPPFRFGIVLLPLLTLSLIPLLATCWKGLFRPLVVGLGAVALSLALVWLVLPGWTYNLANGTSHLIDHLAKSFGSDVGRFFPSYVRIRAASWSTPALVALTALLLWMLSRKQPNRLGAWGTSAALLVTAALPIGATAMVTRVVEFEDVQVSKEGGTLHPEAWVSGRPRFRGGWKLDNGDSLSAPVNSGGAGVDVSIDLQFRSFRTSTLSTDGAAKREGKPSEETPRPSMPILELVVGDLVVPLEGLSARGGWQTSTASFTEWPRGVPLLIRFGATNGDRSKTEVLLDRARFDWQ